MRGYIHTTDRDLLEEEVVYKKLYSNLKSFLVKYGLSMVPGQTDPDPRCIAFWADPEAVEAKRVMQKQYSRLRYCKEAAAINLEGVDEVAEDIVSQKILTQQAYEDLKVFLVKYNLGAVPYRHDPSLQATAFYADVIAKELLKIWRRECERLRLLKHPEAVLQKRKTSKVWDSSHPKERCLYTATFKQEHPEQVAAAGRSWDRRNLKKRADITRAWAKRYPEKASKLYRAMSHRRRARLAGAEGDHTEAEFESVCKLLGDRCTYCGRSLEEVVADWVRSHPNCKVPKYVIKFAEEHMTPLDREGTNYIDNITPSCWECNAHKGTLKVEEFIDWLAEMETPERFAKRLTRIVKCLELRAATW